MNVRNASEKTRRMIKLLFWVIDCRRASDGIKPKFLGVVMERTITWFA